MSDPIPGWLEIVAGLSTFAGAFLFLASAIGLLRLPDFYTRVHSPTKAATLGVAFLGFASFLRSLPRQDLVWIEDVLIIAFLFLTVPVSSQLLLRAAARRGIAQAPTTLGEAAVGAVRKIGHAEGETSADSGDGHRSPSATGFQPNR